MSAMPSHFRAVLAHVARMGAVPLLNVPGAALEYLDRHGLLERIGEGRLQAVRLSDRGCLWALKVDDRSGARLAEEGRWLLASRDWLDVTPEGVSVRLDAVGVSSHPDDWRRVRLECFGRTEGT